MTLLSCPSAGIAGVITFDTIDHGEEATTQLPGITISAINNSFGIVDADGDHPNMALGFRTGETGTRDPDLEGPPWAGGNLPTSMLANAGARHRDHHRGEQRR